MVAFFNSILSRLCSTARAHRGKKAQTREKGVKMERAERTGEAEWYVVGMQGVKNAEGREGQDGRIRREEIRKSGRGKKTK